MSIRQKGEAMSIEDLSPDVVEKVKACKTPEEM